MVPIENSGSKNNFSHLIGEKIVAPRGKIIPLEMEGLDPGQSDFLP
jgi:hypothetical protein